MKPRITISINKDGELEIWLNEAGRDLLVRELQHLSERNDHFHLMPEDFGSERVHDDASSDRTSEGAAFAVLAN